MSQDALERPRTQSNEDRVRSDVQDVVHLYDGAPVHTCLSVLVERQARERLRSLGGTAPG